MAEVWAIYISAGIAAAVGLVAAAIAIWGIRTQREIALKRTTLDMISQSERDKDIIEAQARFNDLAKQPAGLAPYAEKDKLATDDVEKIRVVLNQYEIYAIGIKRGIIDEELYFLWFKSGLLTHWRHAEPFITRLRALTESDVLFREFEWLVERARNHG
ncbi:DUF4760 domain-containing protein [Coralliovum pocilloporae]|uniref:DUF4760 domain-containing protein n=1 Tax=Coralliovum pocilloporae TaxID=3066369 RepID=UPI0033079678